MDKKFDARFFNGDVKELEFESTSIEMEDMMETRAFKDYMKMIDAFIDQGVRILLGQQEGVVPKKTEEFIAVQQQVATATMIADMPRVIKYSIAEEEEKLIEEKEKEL